MAEQIGNFRTVKEHLPGGPEPEPEDFTTEEVSPETEARLKKVLNWFEQARERQSDNRQEQARDQDFVDGDQWLAEDKEELEGRGQPALVFNVIAPTIRWITGTEKRTRVDYAVVPTKEEGQEAAETKTKLLKYLSDTNRSSFHNSMAFYDAATAGIGWLEDGIRANQGEEPLFHRREDWRNILYDHMAIEPDLRDARYIFRYKRVDLDIAQAIFPEHKDTLKAAAEAFFGLQEDEFGSQGEFTSYVDGGWDVDHRRETVRLVECWYQEPCACQVVHGDGGWNGAIYDENDPVLSHVVSQDLASVYDAVKLRMRVMVFVAGDEGKGGKALLDAPSPYWHNRFPFTPVWAYRKAKDGTPYGVVRNLRDPQEDLNKRRSKALFILSTNQTIMDDGAVDDLDAYADEVSRPDAIIVKKPGKELQINRDNTLAAQHLELSREDKQYIQDVGGVTDENMGRQTNATSGKAIQARQNQGVTATADLFDNLRMALQISGEKQLALIEQYYDEPKIVRLTGNRNKHEFVAINQGENQITASQAEFKVDEQAFNQTVRQAMFQTLMELLGNLSQSGMGEIAVKLLDLAVELSDIPQRDEIVQRIRQITGMKDPDDEPTEEEIAAEQAQAQQEAELQQRQVMAQITTLEGKAREAIAKGDLTAMKAIREKLLTMAESMDMAGGMAAVPDLAPVADQLMEDAARGVPQGG